MIPGVNGIERIDPQMALYFGEGAAFEFEAHDLAAAQAERGQGGGEPGQLLAALGLGFRPRSGVDDGPVVDGDRGALAAAVAAMRTLNRDAADALRPFAPNAVTDVTGFGLLGHAYEMASRSRVRIELEAAALPVLPGAHELAADGTRTGGDRRNRDYAGPHVKSTADAVAEALAFDPQTAGGLLVSVPADKGLVLEATFADQGLPLHRVGRVVEGSGVELR